MTITRISLWLLLALLVERDRAWTPRRIDSHAAAWSRQKFLSEVPPALGLLIFPEYANAASPVTSTDTDSLGAMVIRSLRPKPPKILRRKLSQDFAVLLMRSSYNALDQLDCVAMDQFQRDFFLIRRSVYEPYTKALGPGGVQQGDLTDPNYFDFISFAQYETMNREISQDPPFVFEEQQPVEAGDDGLQRFATVLVRRDPSLSNDKLVTEHSRIVGSTILNRLEEIFGGSNSMLTKFEPGTKPPPETVAAALQQLVNVFLISGYAFGGAVSVVEQQKGTKSVANQMSFKIELTSPANLWGGQILQKEGKALTNDFFSKTALAMLSCTAYKVSLSSKVDSKNQQITVAMS